MSNVGGTGNNGNEGILDKYFVIKVQKWGTGENDCVSRVAQTSLNNAGKTDEAGKWSEIAVQQEKIQEYNNKYNEHKIENIDIVEEGQQILIPINDAIAGIANEVEAVSAKYDEVMGKIDGCTTGLTSANTAVQGALSSLQQKQSLLDGVDKEKDPAKYNDFKTQVAALKGEYEKAVQEQEKVRIALKDAQKEAEGLRGEIEQLQKELDEYTDKKDEAEDQIDEDLRSITQLMDGEEQALKEAQDKLTELKQELNDKQTKGTSEGEDHTQGTASKAWNTIDDEAAKALEEADNAVATKAYLDASVDEDGNYDSKTLAGSAVTSTRMVDDGQAKVVEYEDGTYKKFVKTENGFELEVLTGEEEIGGGKTIKSAVEQAVGEEVDMTNTDVVLGMYGTVDKINYTDSNGYSWELCYDRDGREWSRLQQTGEDTFVEYGQGEGGYKKEFSIENNGNKHDSRDRKTSSITYYLESLIDGPQDLKTIHQKCEYFTDSASQEVEANISYENNKPDTVTVTCGEKTKDIDYATYELFKSQMLLGGLSADNALNLLFGDYSGYIV